MTLVKICGLKHLTAAATALEAGADMLGFVFAPSKRQIDAAVVARILSECRRSYSGHQWQAVGVFANQPVDLVAEVAELCKLDVVQLSGEEPIEFCQQLRRPVFKAVHVASSSEGLPVRGMDRLAMIRETLPRDHTVRLLIDTRDPAQWGGTGKTFDWQAVRDVARDCIVAGGLTPSNVGDAIETLHPWAVDVSSGVETNGEKDPARIRQFVSEVRRYDRNAN